jgi:hypothetical protein
MSRLPLPGDEAREFMSEIVLFGMSIIGVILVTLALL